MLACAPGHQICMQCLDHTSTGVVSFAHIVRHCRYDKLYQNIRDIQFTCVFSQGPADHDHANGRLEH